MKPGCAQRLSKNHKEPKVEECEENEMEVGEGMNNQRKRHQWKEAPK